MQAYSQVTSLDTVSEVMVAARPMLRAAVTTPRPKMMSKVIFVLRFICTFHKRKAGMHAVMISIIQARTWKCKSKCNAYHKVALTRNEVITYFRLSD